MERGSVATIVQRLNESVVRYLIAGGLAVAAHGYVRFTADVDLLTGLDADNVSRALQAFAGLGYRPGVPVVAPGVPAAFVGRDDLLAMKRQADLADIDALEAAKQEGADGAWLEEARRLAVSLGGGRSAASRPAPEGAQAEDEPV